PSTSFQRLMASSPKCRTKPALNPERWASFFSGTALANRTNLRTPSGRPSLCNLRLRSRQSATHLLMKATKRESQPVKWVASNSRERSPAVSLNDRLTISTPGNPLGARQLPESDTRKTPAVVRSTNTFGLEAVSGTGFGYLRVLPATRRGDVFDF